MLVTSALGKLRQGDCELQLYSGIHSEILSQEKKKRKMEERMEEGRKKRRGKEVKKNF